MSQTVWYSTIWIGNLPLYLIGYNRLSALLGRKKQGLECHTRSNCILLYYKHYSLGSGKSQNPKKGESTYVTAFLRSPFIRRWSKLNACPGVVGASPVKTTKICTHVAKTDLDFIKNPLD